MRIAVRRQLSGGRGRPGEGGERHAEAYRRALHGAVVENVIGKGMRGTDPVLWFKASTQ